MLARGSELTNALGYQRRRSKLPYGRVILQPIFIHIDLLAHTKNYNEFLLKT